MDVAQADRDWAVTAEREREVAKKSEVQKKTSPEFTPLASLSWAPRFFVV